jgi:hypothetical protein
MKSRKDTVLEIERGFWERSNDPNFFEQHALPDGLNVIESMGFVKQADAAKMSRDAKPWTDVRMQDMHVLDLSEDTMAIAYHGEGTQEGMSEPYRSTVSSVYVRKNGEWKLALTAHQSWKEEK